MFLPKHESKHRTGLVKNLNYQQPKLKSPMLSAMSTINATMNAIQSGGAGIPKKSWQPANVTIETTMGNLVIELYWKHAPNTCRNFAELAKRGYYNGIKFHRIIKDFMIQGGDPTGTGRGGSSIYGKTFEDEISPELKHTGAGIFSMANSGPNTNGSQFFITLIPTQWLDGKHAVFGRVHQGMDVVKRIGLVETDDHDVPLDAIKIIKAYVSS